MESRLIALYKKEDEYEIIEKFPGKTLFGKSYKPLFSYFAHVSQRLDLMWNLSVILRVCCGSVCVYLYACAGLTPIHKELQVGPFTSAA